MHSVVVVSTRNKQNSDNNYKHHYASTKGIVLTKCKGYLKSYSVESTYTSLSDWRSIGNHTTWQQNCTLLSYKVTLKLTAPVTTTMTTKIAIDSFTHMRMSEVMYIWKIMNDPLALTTSAHASIGNRYGLATQSPDGRAMVGCGPWDVRELSWHTYRLHREGFCL